MSLVRFALLTAVALTAIGPWLILVTVIAAMLLLL